MGEKKENDGIRNWKNVQTAEQACQLIDLNVGLSWKHGKALKKTFAPEDEIRITRQIAIVLPQNSDMHGDRLAAESIVETLLVWMAHHGSEAMLQEFFAELFQQSNASTACRTIVEVALVADSSESMQSEELFAIAVAVVCEMGLALQRFDTQNPGRISGVSGVLDHISTYLLSVSNSNNTCIRLSLLNYFGESRSIANAEMSFGRIMNRFGHTILDHLFSLLFQKKSESIALEFLLRNLTNVLAADGQCQRILHEILKFYMLKFPDRFTIFVQAVSDSLLQSREGKEAATSCFAQHIGALIIIASDVNHKVLGRELLVALMKFDASHREALVSRILSDENLRVQLREDIRILKECENGSRSSDLSQHLRSTKRGRRPTMARAGNIGAFEQITFLGSITTERAA